MKDHLPRHLLEKLVADDPAAPVHPALRVHVASCDHCGARQKALEAARARYQVAHPADDFARSLIARAALPEPSRKKRRFTLPVLAAISGLVIAPALGIVWLSNMSQGGAHAMSNASLQVFFTRRGVTRELYNGVELARGDRLAFAYTLEHPRHLLLLRIDDAGTITRQYPLANEDTALPAVKRAQLPLSIKLDARKGDERLLALFSRMKLNENAVRARLSRALASARDPHSGISEEPKLDLPAQQVSVWFHKP